MIYLSCCRKASLALGIIAALGVAGTAHAQTYSTNIVAPSLTQVDQFSVTTAPGSPTFNRPAITLGTVAGPSGNLSGQTAVAYGPTGPVVGGTATPPFGHTFNPTTSAEYVISNTTSGYGTNSGISNFIQFEYSPTFTPGQGATAPLSLQNEVLSDNPSYAPGSTTDSYAQNLTANTPIVLVNTGRFNATAANDANNATKSTGTSTTTISQYDPGSTMNIPDAQQTGTGGPDAPGMISQTLHVTSTQIINSFNSITIAGLDHPYLGDLVISLSHNGVTTFLIDRVGYNGTQGYSQGTSAAFVGSNTYTFALTGSDLTAAANAAVASGDQYANTFPVGGGTYAAQANQGPDDMNSATSLASFVGQSVAGDWTLNVSDAAYTDTGSFLGFYFNVNNPSAAPEPSAWASLGIGILGLGSLGLRARRMKKQNAA